MFRSIWSKSLRDYRVPILAWGLGLALFGAIDFAESTPTTLAVVGSLAPLFRFLGDPYQIQTPEGFITWRIMELFVPLAICFWPILAGARLVRGEEERGTMDVLLATPQSRMRLLLSKIGALVIALLLIALLFALGIVAGEARLGAHVDGVRALLAGLNLSLLAFFFGCLALLFSQFTTSRAVSAGWVSGLLLLSVLLDSTGRLLNGSWVQYLSPFYYYNLNRPLIPSFPDQPLAAVLLASLAVLFAGVSLLLFARRDIGGLAFSWLAQVGQRQPPGNAQPEPGRACGLHAWRGPARPRHRGMVCLLVGAWRCVRVCLLPGDCSRHPAGVLQTRKRDPLAATALFRHPHQHQRRAAGHLSLHVHARPRRGLCTDPGLEVGRRPGKRTAGTDSEHTERATTHSARTLRRQCPGDPAGSHSDLDRYPDWGTALPSRR